MSDKSSLLRKQKCFLMRKKSLMRVKFSHKRIDFSPKRIKLFPKRKEINCLIREQNKLSPKRQNELSQKRRKFFPNMIKCCFFCLKNDIISFGEASDNISN